MTPREKQEAGRSLDMAIARLNRLVASVGRKRSWRASEKAFCTADYARQIEGLQIARRMVTQVELSLPDGGATFR